MARWFFTLPAALALTASSAWAEADGPDAWRVIDVASTDALNVRMGPSTEFPVLDALPHDARGLQLAICVPTINRQQFFAMTEAEQNALSDYPRWCAVVVEGETLGWVNARFLGEDG